MEHIGDILSGLGMLLSGIAAIILAFQAGGKGDQKRKKRK